MPLSGSIDWRLVLGVSRWSLILPVVVFVELILDILSWSLPHWWCGWGCVTFPHVYWLIPSVGTRCQLIRRLFVLLVVQGILTPQLRFAIVLCWLSLVNSNPLDLITHAPLGSNGPTIVRCERIRVRSSILKLKSRSESACRFEAFISRCLIRK